MAYSPVTQGEILTFPCTFVQDDGTPLDISGAALEIIFNPVPGSPPQNVRFIGAGSFALVDGPGGKANYTNVASDTANPGYWIITGVATKAGSQPRYSDPLQLLIRPTP